MEISGHTKLYAFFADPAEHSGSPAMYNAWFREFGIDAVYLAFRVGREGIGKAADAMRLFDIKGANVSMPNKQEIIKYLDEVSDKAKLCGAVNTILNDGGRLKGYNTDIGGAAGAVSAMGKPIRGRMVCIFGMGGAGQAVLTGMAIEGAAHISVMVRRGRMDEHRAFAERISAATGARIDVCNMEDLDTLKRETLRSDIVINATSVGMGEASDKSPIPDASFFRTGQCVMDAIYAPAETRFMSIAKSAGVKSVKNGRDMLLLQGAEAFKIYTGLDISF